MKHTNIVLFLLFCVHHVFLTPLDDYVNKFDPHYGFIVTNYTYKGAGFTLFCINMTSQKWLSGKLKWILTLLILKLTYIIDNDTIKPIWYHALNIAIPDNIKIKDTGFLYIAGGSNNPDYVPDPNDDFNSFITTMAASTGTVAAVIHDVPNQPTTFKVCNSVLLILLLLIVYLCN